MNHRETAGRVGVGQTLTSQTHRLEVLNQLALAIASEHDLERIVQKVTDTATHLSGAQFGAFFYNVFDEQGGRYTLYTLSGAPRSAFEEFGMPRNTAIFDPTFRGAGVIRSEDIRTDPRYGKSAPHHGMPKGHLPVVSYLAVPVVSRTGEVHGGLFFGHERPRMFTDEAEEIVRAMAAHAAIAIDNIRLFDAAQREIERRRKAELAAQRLAAIVESSNDAIVSKSLDAIIESWNRGAERLFGYTPEEVIGQSITIIIPENRRNEEKLILGRIRRGETVEHYETIRRRKDGSLIPISLTVSPVRNTLGEIIGASKIARDISRQKQAEERQHLLVRELHHRVKNLFALAGSIIGLSARSAQTPEELASTVQSRLAALDRAQSLTLPKLDAAEKHRPSISLHDLINAIISPYGPESGERITVRCPDVRVGGRAATDLALLLHEFATNAAKYGALSSVTGKIGIECLEEDDRFVLIWTERGGPRIEAPPERQGFGSRLARTTAKVQLGGEMAHEWNPEGLTIWLSIARDSLHR